MGTRGITRVVSLDYHMVKSDNARRAGCLVSGRSPPIRDWPVATLLIPRVPSPTSVDVALGLAQSDSSISSYSDARERVSSQIVSTLHAPNVGKLIRRKVKQRETKLASLTLFIMPVFKGHTNQHMRSQ